MTISFTKDTYVDGTTGFSAARMNNLNNTLETACQSIHRVATYTVAASNSTDAEKASADYLCDGMADEVQINQAISAAAGLTAAGGRVLLLGGTYTVASPVLMKSYVELVGIGWKTIIKVKDAPGSITPAIRQYTSPLGGEVRMTIRDLQVWGNASNAGGTNTYCIQLIKCSDCLIDHVYTYEPTNTGIELQGCTRITVRNCKTEYCNNGGGIVIRDAPDSARSTACKIVDNDCYGGVGGSSGVTIGNCDLCTVIGNICSSWSFGIVVNSSALNCTIIGNTCHTNLYHGIKCNGSHCQVLGNHCYGNSQNADNVSAGIYLDALATYNNVQQNQSRRGGGANKQKYGIQVYTGATANVVTNNDLYDGGTSGNLQDSGTSTVTTAGNRV